MKPRIVVILGPTGVGKSEVAIDVALDVHGEIISADSLQVYRYLDVGTGKPGPEQRQRVPHHLMDLLDPDEEFNVALFRERALKAEEEIRSRGNNTIVCGGTGLYIKALIHGLFVGPGRITEIRKGLEEDMENKGIGPLYERLKQVDPDGAAAIHPNDRQRVLRALEVFGHTGTKMSRWQRDHGFKENAFDSFKIGLNRERQELYGLIERRCEEMMTRGLVGEVEGLVKRGYSLDLKPLQSVGYRHIGHYQRGEISLDEALSLMKRDTRRLAKRQLTWFRADQDVHWFHPEKERKEIKEATKGFLFDSPHS
jgi:tRNA dimethylallyltransferase